MSTSPAAAPRPGDRATLRGSRSGFRSAWLTEPALACRLAERTAPGLQWPPLPRRPVLWRQPHRGPAAACAADGAGLCGAGGARLRLAGAGQGAVKRLSGLRQHAPGEPVLQGRARGGAACGAQPLACPRWAEPHRQAPCEQPRHHPERQGGGSRCGALPSGGGVRMSFQEPARG